MSLLQAIEAAQPAVQVVVRRHRHHRDRVVMLLENNPYPQDVRVRSEAESLAAAGYGVEVIAPRGHNQSRREEIRGVSVRRFRQIEADGRSLTGFLLEYLIAFMALHFGAIRSLLRGATIVHLHNPPDFLFTAAAIFRLARRRVIFDHHDLFPETVEAKFGRGLAARGARLCERLTFAVADHVIATNDSYAQIARTRGRKRPAEVTVVRNGPPEAWLRLPMSIRPGALGSIRLAYLGAISTQDGVDSLAPVLARLVSLGLDPTLTVVGDGDAREQLEASLRRAGVAERVIITGWVAWEEVPGLLSASDVCVDPAPASEVNQRSTMIKIAEYLALGKPVVAYDLAETRRTSRDSAVLVPPADTERFAAAIAEIARDPTLRSRLATAARERAEQLVWTHSEKALLDAYSEVTP